MDGAVVGGEGGWFVTIVEELVGEGEMASGSATCAFFTEIGRIACNMEDRVAGMIVECCVGVGCRVI